MNLLFLCLPTEHLGTQFLSAKTLLQARSNMTTVINNLSVSSNWMSVVKQLITRPKKQKRVTASACDGDCYSYQRCLSVGCFNSFF